jgi:hypothetical protein
MQTDQIPVAALKPANRAKKAALLSGALFPGAGQIYNGQKIKGIVIIVLTLCFFGIFAYKIATGFNAHFQTLFDFSELTSVDPSETSASVGKTLLQGVFFGAIPALLLWIGATIDAWRTGRGIDDF